MTNDEIKSAYLRVRREFITHPITWERIKGRQQAAEVVAARRQAAKMLRDAGLSFPEIGAILNRDHSTVCNLCAPKWAKKGRK